MAPPAEEFPTSVKINQRWLLLRTLLPGVPISAIKYLLFGPTVPSWDFRQSTVMDQMKSGINAVQVPNPPVPREKLKKFPEPREGYFATQVDIPAAKKEYLKGDIANAPATAEDVIGFWISHGKDSGAAMASRGEKCVMFFHGGGYTTCHANAVPYSSTMLYLSRLISGTRILSVEYRLAIKPEWTFPAALIDAISSWFYLRQMGFEAENITIAGDSAGAGLSLALCLYLRDNGFTIPSQLVLISPWVDLTLSTLSAQKPPKGEAIQSGILKKMVPLYAPSGRKFDKTHPYISPLLAPSLAGLPDTLVLSGAIEVFRDETRQLVSRLRASQVNVRFIEATDLFHDFLLFMTVFPAAAKVAWSRIAKFVTGGVDAVDETSFGPNGRPALSPLARL